MDRVNKVLTFWFGYLDEHVKLDPQSKLYRKWFRSTPEIDQEIRDKFEHDLLTASKEEMDSWLKTAKGCLAAVILFDQMPRNMYRRTPQAYAYDHLALTMTLSSLKQHFERELRLLERHFFYMPLMHCELPEIQEKSLELFSALNDEAVARKDPNLKEFETALKYARLYHDIIRRFGRFPHRNDILGRKSTDEEREFLLNK